MAQRILVLAGSYTQADLWRREHRIPTHRFIYASNRLQVRGYNREYSYVVVGTFYQRPDATDILEVVKYQGHPFVDHQNPEAVRFALAT